jgi:hypothetical protein
MKNKVMSGGSPAPKGGGSLVIGKRNTSMMNQSKGQSMDSAPKANKSITGTGSKPGNPVSAGGTSKTHSATDRAGDMSQGVGGSRKLGNHYSNC